MEGQEDLVENLEELLKEDLEVSMRHLVAIFVLKAKEISSQPSLLLLIEAKSSFV